MTLRIFIGYDVRDDVASKVCRDSLLAHSSIPLDIKLLKMHELRKPGFRRAYFVDESGQMYDARDRKPFSTLFSFTRFLVPHICKYDDEPALFMDGDFLVRADIKELLDLYNPDLAVQCVQHDHKPTEYSKMDGVLQTVYDRKNWSSLMLFTPSKCRELSAYTVNSADGWWLHGMRWAQDDDIGPLPETWNWLVGHSNPAITPKGVHFTGGTPDMELAVKSDFDAEWWAYAKKIPT
jgi:hypothetical protein